MVCAPSGLRQPFRCPGSVVVITRPNVLELCARNLQIDHTKLTKENGSIIVETCSIQFCMDRSIELSYEEESNVYCRFASGVCSYRRGSILFGPAAIRSGKTHRRIPGEWFSCAANKQLDRRIRVQSTGGDDHTA